MGIKFQQWIQIKMPKIYYELKTNQMMIITTTRR